MSKFVATDDRGYMARQLISRVVADAHEVVGLTRGGCVDAVERAALEVAVGDYTDEALLARTVSGAQTVFHLAARVHQRSAGEDDSALFHAVNVVPSEAIARAGTEVGMGRLVMLSSIGVLGNRSNTAAFTDTPVPAPVDSYAVSKLHAEQR